jgi:hypothetical protein
MCQISCKIGFQRIKYFMTFYTGGPRYPRVCYPRVCYPRVRYPRVCYSRVWPFADSSCTKFIVCGFFLWIRYFLKVKKTIKGKNSGPLISAVLVFAEYSGDVTPLTKEGNLYSTFMLQNFANENTLLTWIPFCQSKIFFGYRKRMKLLFCNQHHMFNQRRQR